MEIKIKLVENELNNFYKTEVASLDDIHGNQYTVESA